MVNSRSNPSAVTVRSPLAEMPTYPVTEILRAVAFMSMLEGAVADSVRSRRPYLRVSLPSESLPTDLR